MMRKLESQISSSQSQLEEIDKSLASGKMLLREYDFQRLGYKNRFQSIKSNLKTRHVSFMRKNRL